MVAGSGHGGNSVEGRGEGIAAAEATREQEDSGPERATLTDPKDPRSVAGMELPSRPPTRRPRPASAAFRPQFTLVAVYFFAFFLFFCLLLALPALLEGLRSLPPSEGPITDQERKLAAELTRDALRGRLPYALLATVVTLGLGLWAKALPGLRQSR